MKPVAVSFGEPFLIADLRFGRWASVPPYPGVYRWYFPQECLDSLGIAAHCDTEGLNLHQTHDGMVGLYFGIATSLAQRVEWHAAQHLGLSALRSGFLSTYRFSLLALTETDYLTGEDSINSFMDSLKISWAVTPSKAEAECIEGLELAGEYHYPINIQKNIKPEVASFVHYLKERRRAYKKRFLGA